MIDYFLKGGLLMYPLAACSLIALAVILEKAVQFGRARPPKGQADAVLQAVRSGRMEEARSLCAPNPRPLARLFAAALEGRNLPRADLENTLSRLGSRELKRLGHRLHWLGRGGRIAPMIGVTGDRKGT